MKKAATILALLIKGAIFYFIVIFGINRFTALRCGGIQGTNAQYTTEAK
jgi:hypothetical protein